MSVHTIPRLMLHMAMIIMLIASSWTRGKLADSKQIRVGRGEP